MKKKPHPYTRQGKSNANIKSFLSNLKENDLHFEDSQITQCVFLGVLRLKPVPSVFSSNNVPSVVLNNKSKRCRNNNSTKEINKNVTIGKKDNINKVISGRVVKKNPDKVKATISKFPTKKPVIKLNFTMNRDKKDSSSDNVPETVRILSESLTKITPESVFTNQTITLNPITTVPTINPVQNLFDKLKQQLDDKYSTQVSKESLFLNEPSKKLKKSNKKHKPTIYDRLSTPSCSSFSDNGYYSSNSSINTKMTEDVILYNETDVDDEDCEVLLNTGPMSSFVLQPNKNKLVNNNEVILIPDDTSNRSSPTRDLIVIEDMRSIRMSPRLNNCTQQKDNDVINVDEADGMNKLPKNTKGATEKPIKRRRTLLPSAIPSIFFNTPRLLRSELGQKKVTDTRTSKSPPKPETKPTIKQKKEKEAKTKNSMENLIYEVVKSTEILENDTKSQDQLMIVENSPPKVEPLIIKLKKSTEKASSVIDQNGNEEIRTKEKGKVTKNLFSRLLRSDINQDKETKTVATKKTAKTATVDEPVVEKVNIPPCPGKITIKSSKELFENDSNVVKSPDEENKKKSSPPIAEKSPSYTKKSEKTTWGNRRSLRSDINQEEIHPNVVNIKETNAVVEIPEKQVKDSENLTSHVCKEKIADQEVIDVDLYEEKSKKSSTDTNEDSEKSISINLNLEAAENEQEVINIDETVCTDGKNVEECSQKSSSKIKSIAVVQPMSRLPKTHQKNELKKTPPKTKTIDLTAIKKTPQKTPVDLEVITVAQFYPTEDISTERRQLRSDDAQKPPIEKENQLAQKKSVKVKENTAPKADGDNKSTLNEVVMKKTVKDITTPEVDGDKSVANLTTPNKKAKTKDITSAEGGVGKSEVELAKPRLLRSNIVQKEEQETSIGRKEDVPEDNPQQESVVRDINADVIQSEPKKDRAKIVFRRKKVPIRNKVVKRKKIQPGHKRTADYQITKQADLIVNTTRSQSKVGIEKEAVKTKTEEIPIASEIVENTDGKVPKLKRSFKNKVLKKKIAGRRMGRPRKKPLLDNSPQTDKNLKTLDDVHKKTADVVIMKQADTLIVHTKRSTAKTVEKLEEVTSNKKGQNKKKVAVKNNEKLKDLTNLKKKKVVKVVKKTKKAKDGEVIAVNVEKKSKKSKGVSSKLLRSSTNQSVVKEEALEAPIVEKVVALIHSEPKPKDFYAKEANSKAAAPPKKPRTLRSNNIQDADAIKVVTPKKRGRPKLNKDVKKENQGVSKKSKAITKKKALKKLVKSQSARKTKLPWKNNNLIERIIREIKNTIFKQAPKIGKSTSAKNYQRKKVKQQKNVLRVKKKVMRTKEALKRRLRTSRSTQDNKSSAVEETAKDKTDSVVIINEITVPKDLNNDKETAKTPTDAESPGSKNKDITVFDFEESEPEVAPLRALKVKENTAVPSEDVRNGKETEKTKKNLDTSEYDKRIFFEDPTGSRGQEKPMYSEILVYSDEDIPPKRVNEVEKPKERQEPPSRKRKLLIPFLDDEGKPRKLWSIIDSSVPIPSEAVPTPPPPPPRVAEVPTAVEKSPESDKKPLMKQPTIIEMFSKVWMKMEAPTKGAQVGSTTTEEDVFARPVQVPAAATPVQRQVEDDDSDTESRVEWIPEEYAEYKYKYSSNKMMQYKPIFKCKICMMMFPSYYRLLKHRKEHEKQDKPYCCPQCGTDFSNVEDFSAHLRIHKGKHPYMCSKCDAGFWTKSAYEAHIPVHILKKAKQPVKKFRCDICAKEFSKLCDVERHTRVHTGEKPCICNICNKRFQQAHNLSKHLITHLHIKPFHCEICNKQFGRNDVLRRHLLTHSVDKPVKCEVCFKGFIRHTQLLQHMRRKHPDTPINDALREQFGDEEELSDGREESEDQPSSSSNVNKEIIKTEA